MKSFNAIVTLVGLVATTALAASNGLIAEVGGLIKTLAAPGNDQTSCMTDNDALAVAQNFQSLIAHYSDADADKFLSKNFVDDSDSVNTLIDSGCANGPAPLGQATFTSLEAFKKGQGSQPAIPFEMLNVWHNCNTVTLRWRSNQTPQAVTGIVVMNCVQNGTAWQIDHVFSEFNSGAWLVNLGKFHPTCKNKRRTEFVA